MFVNRKTLIALIAKWGIQQCSLPLPFQIHDTLMEINEKMEEKFAPVNNAKDCGYINFENTKELEEYLTKTLDTCEKFRKWNLTKFEYDRQIDVDDPARGSFKASSRYDAYVEYSDGDFIDLGALIRNVVNDIERDHLRNEEFDERFWREHGKLE